MPTAPKQAFLSDDLRAQILALGDDFFAERERGKVFVPGETYIPCAGKVLDADDLRHLLDASLDMWLTAGRYATEFEAALAARFGLQHCRLTVSGSAANLLAFTALTSWKLHERRIAPGSEVVTVAAGFPTTVAPIVQNGCTPVFVDVDLETANVNVEKLAAAIGPKTRAIMLAHTLGNPFNVGAVAALAKENNLYLIEDCCDALGATFGGRHVGTFGDLATISFYPAHHITMGEGGAVLMNRKSMATLVESYRDWGRDCWCAPGEREHLRQTFRLAHARHARGLRSQIHLRPYRLQHEGDRYAGRGRRQPVAEGRPLHRGAARQLRQAHRRLPRARPRRALHAAAGDGEFRVRVGSAFCWSSATAARSSGARSCVISTSTRSEPGSCSAAT